MYRIRYSSERGKSVSNWLNSSHTFSFADYYDPHYMGFSDLRVINDDYVAPGKGFDTHAHSDMEIISIVLEGRLEHKDSMGYRSVIDVGDVQRMSAGTGVTHSEYNASTEEKVHFLQIWLYPDRKGLKPSYSQKSYSREGMHNKFRLIAAPNECDGAVGIHQNAEISIAKLENDAVTAVEISHNRKYWIHVATGKIEVHGETLQAGDGMAITDEKGTLEFKGLAGVSTIILFNLRNTVS